MEEAKSLSKVPPPLEGIGSNYGLRKLSEKVKGQFPSRVGYRFHEVYDVNLGDMPGRIKIMKGQPVFAAKKSIVISDVVIGKGTFRTSYDFFRHSNNVQKIKIRKQKEIKNMGICYASQPVRQIGSGFTGDGARYETDLRKAGEFSGMRPMASCGDSERIFNVKLPQVNGDYEGYLEGLIAKGYGYFLFDGLFLNDIGSIVHSKAISREEGDNALIGIREAVASFVRDAYVGFQTLYNEDLENLYIDDKVDREALAYYYIQLYRELIFQTTGEYKPHLIDEKLNFFKLLDKADAGNVYRTISALTEIVEVFEEGRIPPTLPDYCWALDEYFTI